MTPLSDSEARTVARFENAEPAPESWDGGLREALVEAIWVNMPDEPYRQDADIAADAVLALPELAALRAKAAAADRVRALADDLDRTAETARRRFPDSGMAAAYQGAAIRIRAALDGPPC